MFHSKTFPPKGEPFKLLSVVKTQPPAGATGGDWRRYEIAQGDGTIVGYRQGDTGDVRLEIEEMVVQLNKRRVGDFGRVQQRV